MSDLYKRIEELCKRNNTNITAMCKESGASRASLTDLKVGRNKRLSSDTLSKIANYFGVSVDYLLGNEQKENAPDELSLTEDEIRIIKALREKPGGVENLAKLLGIT
jgi:transcriptional regulator with XRE-family HTH domain